MTQTTKTILLSIIASLAVCFLLINWMGLKPQQASNAKESVYDRVMRTGTIRCGYYVFAPVSMREGGAGKLHGFGIEAMEKIAGNMGLKVEWAEEVNFGTMFQGLESGRYDAICTPTWPDATRGRAAIFGVPMLYAAVTAYGRADDHRFDGNLKKLNDPSVKLAVIDGSTSDIIAHENFPKAQLVSLPQATPDNDLLMNVVTGKADATFWDKNAANQYLEANPGSIREIPGGPLRIFPFEMVFPRGEHNLRAWFDTAVLDILNSGYFNTLLDKYEKYPDSFFRVANPYQPLSVRP